MKRPALAFLIGLAALGVLAPSAGAHATLTSTVPERGAELAQPPPEVRLEFNEAVELSFGSVRVFDAYGEEVQSGDPEHPGGEDSVVSVALPTDLPDGSYTATYRVVSADGHPISGGFVYAVGEGSAAPVATVSELVDGDETSDGTKVAFAAARAGSYAAIALAIGGAVFLLAVWGGALARVGGSRSEWVDASERLNSRARILLAVAVGTGLICTAAGIVLQGAVASGLSPLDALDTSVIGDVLDTRFGTVWGARLAIWVALGLLLWAAGSAVEHPPRGLVAIGCVLLAALAVTPALAGHAATQGPTLLLVPSTVAHVIAMSVWAGGLAMLVFAVPAATRSIEPRERTRLLAAVLERFSPIALGAVIALLATGVLQSLLELDSFSALFDTTFGRLILVKSALLAILICLGAWNRRRSLPQIERLADDGETPGPAGVALRRVLRAEVALIAGAFIATSFLAAQTPSSEAGGPASGSADLGAARLDYTVDPASPGANEIHLYLTDTETGAPFEVRSAELSASQLEREIGALDIALERTGPGHFTATAAQLSPPGEWTLELQARLSRFEELRGEFEVAIE